MSTLPAHRQQEWEYRHLLVVPHPAIEDLADWKQDDPEFVERLVETIEDLDRAREQGWRLLSVKVEQDDRGHCRVNAHLKRRKSTADAPHSATIEMPEGPSPRLDIEKAA